MPDATAAGPNRRPVAGYLWAAPISAIGLAAAGLAAATGGRCRTVGGVLEAHGGALARWLPRVGIGMRPAAMTLGHVVIAVNVATLDRMRAHELVHVAQVERWGIFFPFAYFAASLIAGARGGDPYRDNAFERAARRAE